MSEKQKTILLVDDDRDFVESNKDLLEAQGYRILTAYDGKSGLETALRERPDLMILDVMMASDTEGFEVSRKIPEKPELRNMRVLLVTGIDYPGHPWRGAWHIRRVGINRHQAPFASGSARCTPTA